MWVYTMDLPQEKERWVLVRTHTQVQATKEQMEKKGKKTQRGDGSGQKESGIHCGNEHPVWASGHIVLFLLSVNCGMWLLTTKKITIAASEQGGMRCVIPG